MEQDGAAGPGGNATHRVVVLARAEDHAAAGNLLLGGAGGGEVLAAAHWAGQAVGGHGGHGVGHGHATLLLQLQRGEETGQHSQHTSTRKHMYVHRSTRMEVQTSTCMCAHEEGCESEWSGHSTLHGYLRAGTTGFEILLTCDNRTRTVYHSVR